MLSRVPTRYIILTLLVGVLVSAIGCSTSGDSNNDVTGSGVLETRQFGYTDFTEIALSQGFQASISQADTFSVGLTMDDNLYDYLEIRQTGEKLYFNLKGGSYRDYTAKVNVAMPELHTLELSAASKAELTDFRLEDPLYLQAEASSMVVFSNVEASGVQCLASSSSLVFGRIDLDDGQFTVVASSAVQLEGSADTMSLDVNSASSADLTNFEVADMNVEVSASSMVTINVTGRLDLGVHADSYLKYLGDPIIGEYDVSTGSIVEVG